MYFTAEEFVNDLKLYNYYLEQLEKNIQILCTYYYDLNGKVKSPLDFDRILNKKGEEIRIIKGRSTISDLQKINLRDNAQQKYDKQLAVCIFYKRKINKLNEYLDKMDKITKQMCISIYLDGKSYDKVGKEMNKATMTVYRDLKRRLARYF